MHGPDAEPDFDPTQLRGLVGDRPRAIAELLALNARSCVATGVPENVQRHLYWIKVHKSVGLTVLALVQ